MEGKMPVCLEWRAFAIHTLYARQKKPAGNDGRLMDG